MSLIRREFERVAPEVVKAAAQFPPCIFADVAGRRGAMNGRTDEQKRLDAALRAGGVLKEGETL